MNYIASLRYWPYVRFTEPPPHWPVSWAQWNLGAAPAYRELADVVRLLVLDGRVALDTALPSERALSEALGVSRTTVTAAYGHLREQGS